MGRKKGILLWMICIVMWITTGTVWAGSSGAEPKRDGQTDVMAGVVVDYMGKLRFLVLERGTEIPIPGASVEIYIPSLDRYVLFGLTDANGIYELDIAYNMIPGADLSSQFETVNGEPKLQGTLLYLDSNRIKYQVYKAGWLLYPTQGEEVLETKEVPQTIIEHLYKKKGDSGSGNGDGGNKGNNTGGNNGGNSGGSISSPPFDQLVSLISDAVPLAGLHEDEKGTGGIPKTGVEGAIPYWAAGFVFFLLAGGVLYYLLKKEKGKEMRE